MKKLSRMRKWMGIFLPLFLIIGIAAGSYAWVKPKVRAWVKNKITEVVANNLPLKITMADLNWSLFLPVVSFEGVEIVFEDPTSGIRPIRIEKISARIDFLYLLSGRLSVADIQVTSPNVTMSINKSAEDKPIILPTDMILPALKRIPLQQISIEKGQALLEIPDEGKISISNAKMILQNKKSSLAAFLRLPTVLFTRNNGKTFEFQGEALAEMKAKDLDLNFVKVTGFGLQVEASGQLNDLKNVLVKPAGKIHLEAKSELAELHRLLSQWRKIPPFKGQILINGDIELDRSQWASQGFRLNATELSFADITVGDIKLNGKLVEGKLGLPEIELGNEAGKIVLTKTELQLFDQANNLSVAVATKIKTKSIKLHETFKSLGLGNVPVFLDIATELDCNGPLWPTVTVACKGKMQGQDFKINTSDKNNLVTINEMGATGEFEVTKTSLSYKAQVSIGDSTGESQGVIDYATGFKIYFSTPELQFKHVQNLANLHLEGAGQIQGSTEGTSQGATFTATIDGKEVFFSQFFLGQVKTNVSYRTGLISFDPMKGSVGSSTYEARAAVDVYKKYVEAEGSLPHFEIPEFLSVFQRMFKAPIELTGAGTGTVKVNGPLELGALSYDIRAQVTRGTAAGESYDKAEMHVNAINGEVKIQKAQLVKNKSFVNMSGEGHPNGNINVLIEGRNFLLEESENINKLRAAVTGLFNFTMTLNGPVLAPDAMLQGQLTNNFIEDLEVPASQFSLKVGRASIDGSAQLVGDKLKAEFIWPLQPESPFNLKVNAQDWNYTTLFALIGGGSLLSEYQANLTGNLSLASEKGGLLKATGSGRIQNFLLQRGTALLKNNGPMELTMKDGVASLNNFRLTGDETTLEVRGQQFSAEDLNMKIIASLQLRLLQIFMPFLEELAGTAKLNVNMSGRLERPEVLGDAKVDNGFVKIKAFPHAFERVQAKAQFSQSKIILSNVSGQLAGGTFAGEGNIQIQGLKNFPMQIRAQATNVNFHVPEHIRTHGNAEIVISGSWFPFVLSGTYHVHGGKIDKEFSDEASVMTLKQSSYLPKVILQSAFEPLVLDLQVEMENGVAIKNSLLEGTINGNIQVKGSPTSPGILGRVTTDKSSRLFFRETPFEILSGTVDFKDPSQINPELFISARTRKSDYDVSLLIQGTGKAPILRMSSLPPLAEQDIISLLALGMTSQQLEKRVQSRDQENSTSYAIGSAILSSTREVKDLREKTGINVQLSSQYDDTKNSTVPKLTISRKISERVNASASRAVGEQNSGEVRLQYLINQNVSAVGSWQTKENEETNTVNATKKETDSILGLDLEFKKEFK